MNDTIPIILNEDGGWCWFESPRVLIRGDWLVVGSVASGWNDPARKGAIELIVYNLKSTKTDRVTLHADFELDDHDSPALLQRPDGRWLAMFARHSMENCFYYSISQPNDPLHWQPLKRFVPSPSTELTYSNLFHLPAERGRIYDFYRGLHNSYKPSYAYSDDQGDTWTSGEIFIRVPSTQRHRPYVCYASNSQDTVHMLYTEAHPRDFDNSLYHIYYQNGMLHRSDGSPIRSLSEGLNAPDEGTRIYQSDPNHVAWCANIVLDKNQHPRAVYSVQVGSAGLPRGQGGEDLRYRYARWDGQRWQDYALAYAGTRLYSDEDDYSGLAAIDPDDPSTLYISTNADPESGAPLISRADGKRHYELFRCLTADGGATWRFTPITQNSTQDNLRPICPPSDGNKAALLWLRGTYRTYTDYQQEIVGIVWDKDGPAHS